MIAKTLTTRTDSVRRPNSVEPSIVNRYFHTIKHLKLKQIFYRCWYKVIIPRLSKKLSYKLNPPPISTSFAEKIPSLRKVRSFSFIGHDHDFKNEIDWQYSSNGRLWLYNLHYFDYLNQAGITKTTALGLINDWIDKNPPTTGTGWEPYPTSLRLVNWFKFELQNTCYSKKEQDSAYLQSRWLFQRIEYHVLANHLIANSKALIFAGLFFSGKESDNWLNKGVELLNHELDEQINVDGSHFEMSPMYHAIILEDLIDLRRAIAIFLTTNHPAEQCDQTTHQNENRKNTQPLANSDLVNRLSTTIHKMLCFMETVTHPDGEIAFFNDSSLGIAMNLKALTSYAGTAQGVEKESPAAYRLQKVSASGQAAQSPGYVKASKGGFCLLSNIAPISPPYQPSHAHADTLSFELSYNRSRLLVNSGTSIYSAGDLRTYQRSTRAHNTIEINGKNSSSVWSSFRVAKRAQVISCQQSESDTMITISGAHDGYKTLSGGVLHQREWQLTNTHLNIIDTLDGEYNTAKLYFHFHPDAQLTDTHELVLPGNHKFRWTSSESNLKWSKNSWYPSFGTTTPNLLLEIPIEGSTGIRTISNQLQLLN